MSLLHHHDNKAPGQHFLLHELSPWHRFFHDTNLSRFVNLDTFNIQPRFDLVETDESFELEGEMPRTKSKSNISVQWEQPQTLVVSGKLEKTSTYATDAKKPVKHKADGTDDPETENGLATEKSGEGVGPKLKYWLSERSIGEYSRSFQFPSRVKPDAIKATLKDGILHIHHPKESEKQVKTIQIEEQ